LLNDLDAGCWLRQDAEIPNFPQDVGVFIGDSGCQIPDTGFRIPDI